MRGGCGDGVLVTAPIASHRFGRCTGHHVLAAMDGRRHGGRDCRRRGAGARAHRRVALELSLRLDARAVQCGARHCAARAAVRARRITGASRSAFTKRAPAASIRRCARSCALGASTGMRRPCRPPLPSRRREPSSAWTSSSFSTRRTHEKRWRSSKWTWRASARDTRPAGSRSCSSEHGSSGYLAEIGGEIVARGTKPDGSAWRIGVENPVPGAPAGPALRMPLCGADGRYHKRVVSALPRGRWTPLRSHHRPAQRLARRACAPVRDGRRRRRGDGGCVGHGTACAWRPRGCRGGRARGSCGTVLGERRRRERDLDAQPRPCPPAGSRASWTGCVTPRASLGA